MIKLFCDLKDRIWDFLFLDFYLDKHWTLEFKIINFISGDFLRCVVTSIHYNLENADNVYPESIYRVRRAKFWSDAAWRAWRKE